MTDATAPAPVAAAPEQNGKPQELKLPEGTLQLPQSMVARLTRLLQEDRHVHDMLYAYIEGKEATGPFTLVLPVVLLVKPQQQQGGP